MTMARTTKTTVGIPDPLFPRGVVLREQAAIARARLYPGTFLYTACAAIALVGAWRSRHPCAAVSSFLLGMLAWTWLEYQAHKHVLHGVFPPGPGSWRRALHVAFDHLHWEHHQRPWDGNHINGTLKDTLPFALALLGIAWLVAPSWIGPLFIAGLTFAYVLEEWTHHAVHFYTLPFGWFRGLKARHFHHHSPVGKDTGFGLSSPLWDILLDSEPDDPSLDRVLRPS